MTAMRDVCHSRGGLVARTLAEAGDSGVGGAVAGRSVHVNRVIFVAPSNNGTALVDGPYMTGFLDRITTGLNLASIINVDDWLQGVLLGVQLAGHGLLEAMPGLVAMQPEHVPVREQVRREYYALAADFDPEPLRMAQLVRAAALQVARGAADVLMDKVFAEAANDLVVPTDGVYLGNRTSSFPIPAERVVRFDKETGVMHTNFFAYPETAGTLERWLVRNW